MINARTTAPAPPPICASGSKQIANLSRRMFGFGRSISPMNPHVLRVAFGVFNFGSDSFLE